MTSFSDNILSGNSSGAGTAFATEGAARLSKQVRLTNANKRVQFLMPAGSVGIEPVFIARSGVSAAGAVTIRVGNSADETHYCSFTTSAANIYRSPAALSGASLAAVGTADKIMILDVTATDAAFDIQAIINYTRT